MIPVPSKKTTIYSRDSLCPDNNTGHISGFVVWLFPSSETLVGFQFDYPNKCLALELQWYIALLIFWFNQLCYYMSELKECFELDILDFN